VTAVEAELSKEIPMADELCVEADSGGHTDQGVALTLVPAILALRDGMVATHAYRSRVAVGSAGGIGTPQAAAAAFVLGAEFILTGSINQCTIESGTSAAVKDLLQSIDVQDTTYAPAGDMFELGAKVQVVRRGLFFPSRANKLYEIYQRYDRIEDIDSNTRGHIQEKYFKRSFEDVWHETRAHYLRHNAERVLQAEKHPKQKMAMIFKWYFVHTSRLALAGAERKNVDYQIHCGPALGAFNQWVKGTAIEDWRSRKVAEIAELIMTQSAAVLNSRFRSMASRSGTWR